MTRDQMAIVCLVLVVLGLSVMRARDFFRLRWYREMQAIEEDRMLPVEKRKR